MKNKLEQEVEKSPAATLLITPILIYRFEGARICGEVCLYINLKKNC